MFYEYRIIFCCITEDSICAQAACMHTKLVPKDVGMNTVIHYGARITAKYYKTSFTISASLVYRVHVPGYIIISEFEAFIKLDNYIVSSSSVAYGFRTYRVKLQDKFLIYL